MKIITLSQRDHLILLVDSYIRADAKALNVTMISPKAGMRYIYRRYLPHMGLFFWATQLSRFLKLVHNLVMQNLELGGM